jgi:cyclopropane-fatty-acyl-phospholipid synthase
MSAATSLREREGAKYGGSAEGIRHHYDIGNDFWRLMLGPTFTYSAALFARPDEDLETAQNRKIDWHLTSAGVDQATSVLEVGCGWGTILRRLAEKPAIERVVGLTLSDAQAEYLASLRLPNVEIRVENWAVHQPEAPYDSIISIGAFEHFAKAEESSEEKLSVYRDFFERCHRWLSPSGSMSLQTIAYGNMKRDQASDFMNKEIYPDSDLPFLAEVVAAVDGLFEVVAVRNDRLDYARSYDGWGANLRRRRDEAVSMVGEEQVRRFERFFKLGSIGFRMGKLGLLRFTLRPITKNWTLTGSERWGAARLRLV